MATVAITALSKLYDGGGELAVKDLSLTVADGEFMVLLGPSGCGKSSVLRMIAGLEPITSGTVAIDGKVVNEVPAKDRDIAMVFQSYALYPHMDVFNNLAFGLRRRGIAASEIERRVQGAAAKLGLLPFLKRKPHALSGGQRQRVALGRAIVREPKVFLFDEPLSNLDAALRVSTRNELIRQQRELGITAIYVTHDQIEAMTMGHRICIMSKGEVVQIGNPLEVYRNPANTFVARFLGNPPMNLIPVTIQGDARSHQLRFGGTSLAARCWPAERLSRLDGKALLGIRPEDVYEASPRSGDERLVAITGASVVAVEPLGAETLVFLSLPGVSEEVIVRSGRESKLRPGEHAMIQLDLGAAHLFDQATTEVIARIDVKREAGWPRTA
ncbi:MAG: sn-glycerol-3-phosphate ABC transporter ATP-binding protein UgpC [Hyphomicrobiales bacterium]|nr:sn-glycerol-3-phosphate ABC transporter ATP-binding protein UgpC [Hyphomicrobiales bacterium]